MNCFEWKQFTWICTFCLDDFWVYFDVWLKSEPPFLRFSGTNSFAWFFLNNANSYQQWTKLQLSFIRFFFCCWMSVKPSTVKSAITLLEFQNITLNAWVCFFLLFFIKPEWCHIRCVSRNKDCHCWNNLEHTNSIDLFHSGFLQTNDSTEAINNMA